MAVEIKSVYAVRETINYEGFGPVAKPIHRVVVAGVIDNPYAGKYSENLDLLIEAGAEVGGILIKEALELLPGGGAAVENYCKAALIGTNGEKEHGGAVLHPKLGKPMREAISQALGQEGTKGCSALISCNKKVCLPGAKIDLPLMFRDYAAIRSHYDTIPDFNFPGHPLPNEIVVIVGVTDGGRPHPRLGGKTIEDYLAAGGPTGTMRDGAK